MDTKKGQDGAGEAQVGPKTVQIVPRWGRNGGKMGTQKGQDGAREAQVGPTSGQKKGPRI